MQRTLITLGLLAVVSTGCATFASGADATPSDAGTLIRTVGHHKLKGDVVRELIVAPATNGAQRLTIIVSDGSLTPQVDLQPEWFVFVAPNDRLWLYYGAENLVRMAFSGIKTDLDSVLPGSKLAAEMPVTVREHLPSAFQNKLAPGNPPPER